MSTSVMPFHEAIQKRPGMYLGTIGSVGVGLIISNLISDVAVEFHARKAQVLIAKDGRTTIEFPDAKYNFCSILDILSFKKSESWWFMLSLAIIPPLSNGFTIKIGKIKFTVSPKGRVTPIPAKVENRSGVGLKIQFTPNAKILKAKSPDVLRLFSRLRELSIVIPGLKIIYRDNTTSPFSQMSWLSKTGIRELLAESSKRWFDRPFETGFSFVEDKLRGEVYWLCANGGDEIKSFVDGQPTKLGGSHVKGCVQGIVDGIKDFVKDRTDRTYDFGVKRATQHQCLVVSIWGEGFDWAGSTKDCLEHEPTRKILRKLVSAHMKQLCESHPKDVEQLTYRLKKWNPEEMYPDLYPKKSREKKA